MKRRKYFIIPVVALFMATNVSAITSNDVTYDNNGTTESLTTSLDTAYSELKKYKTGGSVKANQMLEGATGYSKGVLVTGTIKSKGATTYTPGTSNQMISSGQYLSGTQTIVGDADLKPENIKDGIDIFGVLGSHTAQNHNFDVIKMERCQQNGGRCDITGNYVAPAPGVLLVYMGMDIVDGGMSNNSDVDVTICHQGTIACDYDIKATEWRVNENNGKTAYWIYRAKEGDEFWLSLWAKSSGTGYLSGSITAFYIY